MGLFDVFKKKNEAELFVYDETNKKYTATIGGIEFSSRIAATPEMMEYAKKISGCLQEQVICNR